MIFRKALGWAILAGLVAVLIFGAAQTVGWYRVVTVGGGVAAFYAALMLAIYLLRP